MRKLPTVEELKQRCQELGVDTTEVWFQSGKRADARPEELQRRLIEAERSLREHRLWIVAVVSAIASLASAIAACYAVIVGK